MYRYVGHGPAVELSQMVYHGDNAYRVMGKVK